MRKSQTVQKVPFLAPDVIAKTIPAPVDGWDAISPLAEMDPKRAPILNNWVPRPGYVELRGGYYFYTDTNFQAAVESLMVYRSSTTEKMFAGVDAHIVDVSTSMPSTSLSGLSNARWQYVNFTSGGGVKVLQAVNGADSLIQFDGSSWSTPTITGLPGGSTANIINIHAQKQRLWYVMNQSTVVAYMPTGAISGAIAGTQDFGTLWSKGGYMTAIASWTIDGGSGPQDYVLFMSSRGQATLYSGIDPTNPADWGLVGTFDLSPPLGRRCMTRIGSDVAVISQDGVLPISQALPFDPSADRSIAITARIQNAMSVAASNGKDLFGWELISFPTQQLIILNVPQVENQQQVQFVMNALTGAWCQFIGWNANTFAIYNNLLYWGDNNGHVNQGYVGSSDNASAIFADMQCAFNWFDDPGRVKRMTMVQPLLTLGSGVTPTLGVDTDFQTSGLQAPVTSFTGTVLWDVAQWDVSLLPSLTVNFNKFLTVDAIGHALALRMQVNVSSLVGSAAFDNAQFDVDTFATSFDFALPVLQVNAFNSVLELGGAI
jgi:hypothetical protein